MSAKQQKKTEGPTPAPAAPADDRFEARRTYPPLVYEVLELDGASVRRVRFTARQIPVYESHAVDRTLEGEPWYDAAGDATGISGPLGVRANRERLRAVVTTIENVKGIEGPIEGRKALDAFLDDEVNSELVYLAWDAYKSLSRTERLLFRRIQDPGAGDGGDAGKAVEPATAERPTA